MAYSPIALVAPNYRDYTDYWLKAYAPGTTTPKIMALDSAASVTVAKLQLNADGFLKSAGGTLVIPYIEDSYDLWLFPTEAEADANNTVNAEKLADNINALNESVINDLSLTYTFKSKNLMVASLIVFPVGKKIFWQGYYAQSDGGSNWGVVNSGTHTDDGGSIFTLADGKYIKANIKVASVRKFGAVGDKVTDDLIPINNAIAYSRNFIASKGLLSGTITVSFGGIDNDYLVSAPINATGIRQPVNIDLDGATLWGNYNDTGPVLDLVDSRYVKVRNGKVKNAPGKTPMAGILQGRRASDIRVASDIGLINVNVTGDFAITPWANISSEESVLDMCRFENNLEGGDTVFCGIMSNVNTYGLASIYQTLTTETVSSTLHTWRRVSFRRRGSNQGFALDIKGANRIEADHMYLIAQGDFAETFNAKACVRIAAVTSSTLKFYAETEIAGGGADSIGLIEEGSMQRNDFQFSGFGATAASTQVLLINEVSEIKDCKFKASGIRVVHTGTATVLKHCILYGNNGGFVNLSGATLFSGDIWVDSDADFTTLGNNAYDLYARFIYDMSIQTPRTPRLTSLSANALVNPRLYSQIIGTGDFETITDGNNYFRDGASLLVRAVTGSTVTVKHNVGNIKCKSNGDFVLPTNAPSEFIYDEQAGNVWLCME